MLFSNRYDGSFNNCANDGPKMDFGNHGHLSRGQPEEVVGQVQNSFHCVGTEHDYAMANEPKLHHDCNMTDEPNMAFVPIERDYATVKNLHNISSAKRVSSQLYEELPCVVNKISTDL